VLPVSVLLTATNSMTRALPHVGHGISSLIRTGMAALRPAQPERCNAVESQLAPVSRNTYVDDTMTRSGTWAADDVSLKAK
jgi:hypothetical protein